MDLHHLCWLKERWPETEILHSLRPSTFFWASDRRGPTSWFAVMAKWSFTLWSVDSWWLLPRFKMIHLLQHSFYSNLDAPEEAIYGSPWLQSKAPKERRSQDWLRMKNDGCWTFSKRFLFFASQFVNSGDSDFFFDEIWENFLFVLFWGCCKILAQWIASVFFSPYSQTGS